MDEPNLDEFNAKYANSTVEDRELILKICSSAFDVVRKNIRFVFDETTQRFKAEKDPTKNYSDHESDEEFDDDEGDDVDDYDEYDDDVSDDDNDDGEVEEKPVADGLSEMSDDELDLQIKNLTDVISSKSCNSQDESQKLQVELDSLLAERQRRLLNQCQTGKRN